MTSEREFWLSPRLSLIIHVPAHDRSFHGAVALKSWTPIPLLQERLTYLQFISLILHYCLQLLDSACPATVHVFLDIASFHKRKHTSHIYSPRLEVQAFAIGQLTQCISGGTSLYTTKSHKENGRYFDNPIDGGLRGSRKHEERAC